MPTHRSMIATAFALAFSTGTWAADLEAQDYNGVRYLSGGVGAAEVDAMREAAPDYRLGLTFAAQSGAYLADVGVKVKNRAGEVVLDTVADGPMLLVDLPAGRYTVEASFEGETRTRQVSLPQRGHRQFVIHWPLPAAEPATGAAGSPGPSDLPQQGGQP